MHYLKIIFLFLILLSLYSCRCFNQYSVKVINSDGGFQVSVLKNQNVTARWNQTGSKETAEYSGSLAVYVLENLSAFENNYTSVNDSEIDPGTNDYQLFFNLGLRALSSWNNDFVRYGLIEKEWHDLIIHPEKVKGFHERNPVRSWLRIGDFEDLFGKYTITDAEFQELNNYIVHYLLKNILFVSIQEIISRPERYLNSQEIETVFCQAVIFPETEGFVRFILSKYGTSGLLKLAKSTDYKKDWKSIFGEEINETESAFTKNIEAIEWKTGVFSNKEMISNLDDNLKLYNKLTKPTLFRK